MFGEGLRTGGIELKRKQERKLIDTNNSVAIAGEEDGGVGR